MIVNGGFNDMAEIKTEISKGVFYVAVAKYSGILIQLLVTAILARILKPEDFGVVAILTVFMTFFNILSDVGISPAIIQKKDLSTDDINHIYSFTIYLGLILTLVFFFCSWPISWYYDNALLLPVCQTGSIMLFFVCAKIVPFGLLSKDKLFRFQSIANIKANGLAGSISVISALMGAGLYSLVLYLILSSVVTYFLYYQRFKLKFICRISLGPLKRICSYSVYVMFFNIVNYFSRNLDKLLVGKFIGMSPLGYYEKSYRLMQMPLQTITFVITPVLHPVFSEYQNDFDFIANKYLKLINTLSIMSFPLSVLLFFLSKELVLIIFGSQWQLAVPSFKILALTVALQMLTSTSGSIFQAVNATKQFFLSGCFCAFFMITSFVLAIIIYGTIESVAWAFFFAQIANTIQCFWILFKILNVNFKRIIMAIYKPFILGLLLFVIILGFETYMIISNLLLSLIIKTFVFFCFSVFLFMILKIEMPLGFLLNRLHRS